jgi:hypothetical protein
MSGRGIQPTLRRSLERGDYRVDSRAVAEAIVRSWMLVATQSRNGSVRVEKSQAGTG